MSNRRHPTTEPLHAGEGQHYSLQMAAVDHHDNVDAVDWAMQQTHDRVIASAGSARRSGVQWTTVAGSTAVDVARSLLDRVDHSVYADGHIAQDSERAASDQQLLDYLKANPYALLVIAWVVVDGADWKALHP